MLYHMLVYTFNTVNNSMMLYEYGETIALNWLSTMMIVVDIFFVVR